MSSSSSSVEDWASDADAAANADAWSDPQFPYKHSALEHFNTRLDEMLGCERDVLVPDDVIERIATECRGGRFADTPIADVGLSQLQKVLKSLRLLKYSRNTTQILFKITGHPPPCMSAEERANCLCMFRVLRTSFEKREPNERRGFLNFSFCIYKICEIAGYTRFLPLISRRGPTKLQKEKAIYKDELCRIGMYY